jgi:hypothetical protein
MVHVAQDEVQLEAIVNTVLTFLFSEMAGNLRQFSFSRSAVWSVRGFLYAESMKRTHIRLAVSVLPSVRPAVCLHDTTREQLAVILCRLLIVNMFTIFPFVTIFTFASIGFFCTTGTMVLVVAFLCTKCMTGAHYCLLVRPCLFA